jgi:hypothetical protein
MDASRADVGATGSYQLGVSRPPLEVVDLPVPEEVFGVQRIGSGTSSGMPSAPA